MFEVMQQHNCNNSKTPQGINHIKPAGFLNANFVHKKNKNAEDIENYQMDAQSMYEFIYKVRLQNLTMHMQTTGSNIFF